MCCFGLNVEALFRQSLALASDPTAAAILTLARVIADQQPDEDLLNTEEAAKILGTSRAHTQALARDGVIRSVRVGKLVKFRREYLDEYLKPKPQHGRHW